MRKKITVPAAGEKETFTLIGQSVVIEDAGLYTVPEQVPLLGFAGLSPEFPVYPLGKIPYWSDEKFRKVTIQGTDESAGDEVHFLTVDECLPFEIKPNYAGNYSMSIAGTQTKQASNDVKSFSNMELANAEGKLPKKLYIFVTGGATRGINYAFDNNPVQGDGDTSSLYWNNDNEANKDRTLEVLEIDGILRIQAFKFIAAVQDETPTLVWDADY